MNFFKTKEQRIIWECEGETLWMEPFGENCLRFRSTRCTNMTQNDWNLLPQNECAVQIKISDNKANIINGKISAEILADGTVNYYSDKGEPLLKEYWLDRREHNAPLRPARHYRAISSDPF